MHPSFESNIDRASEYIAHLQTLMQQLPHRQKGIEGGIIQQYLDSESLYIKQIPHVNFKKSLMIG